MYSTISMALTRNGFLGSMDRSEENGDDDDETESETPRPVPQRSIYDRDELMEK